MKIRSKEGKKKNALFYWTVIWIFKW